MAQGQQELQVGDDLYVMMVPIAELKERDINAQIMQPRHLDRLTENIRNRGQVEALPYVSWPERQGPKVIISGHHRSRAARNAGLDEIPCLVDTRPMTESQLTSKQISHNEIHGTPDQQILAQMLTQVTDVDDLLATGLPEDQLPTPAQADAALGLPHASFDWKVLTFLFLPHQLEQLKQALDSIDKHSTIIGITPREDFEEFSKQVIEYGRSLNIRSVGAAVSTLIGIAKREIDLAERDGIKPDGSWVRTAELVGPSVPPDAVDVIRRAVATCLADGDIPTDQPWRALEYICADFVASA